MKKLILFLIIATSGYLASAQMTVTRNFNQDLGSSTLDTLTNTDTTTYTVAVSGHKPTMTWLWKQTKISGTVTQSLKIYGSLDAGTTYTTYAVDSIVGSNNASTNYSLRWTNSPFTYYKVIILSSGTQSFSQRLRLRYAE